LQIYTNTCAFGIPLKGYSTPLTMVPEELNPRLKLFNSFSSSGYYSDQSRQAFAEETGSWWSRNRHALTYYTTYKKPLI